VFTGLVEDLGTVTSVAATRDGVRIAITSALAGELKEGDSVAVNGVCLTATMLKGGSRLAPYLRALGTRRCNGELFGADVMNETLRRSSLSELEPGSRVNLELPLKPDSRLGGHIVQGHVDGVGAVAGIADDGFARRVTVAADPELLRYVVEKGSITVDGVSLTVASVDDTSFDVSLIPETLERTTLGATEEGTPVNLEVDIVAKYVEKLTSGGRRPDDDLRTRGRMPRGGDSS
jgi:riboflavin synthase